MPELLQTESTLALLHNPSLLKKYDLSGPRYTSYPTAPQFVEGFGRNDLIKALSIGNETVAPLSLYFHIPFCDTVCYYCGCNKIITANKQRAIPYLEAIIKEMDLIAPFVAPGREVEQLHFGGGTPTYLSNDQLEQLMNAASERFTFAAKQKRDFSIEIHPAGMTPDRVRHLREIGFNRLSMGVQDFDPQVQKAVNRFNSIEEVDALAEAARASDFLSISMDLIYGLPLQTPKSFSQTLSHIIELSPDRIALFNYAHLPHMFKTQKQIDATQLPEPQEKLIILQESIQTLTDAGYQFIGMDHFAKASDSLSQAQQQGKLHRNFQGYTTHGECDLLAFGVSSISMAGNSYSQNTKNIDDYYAAIHAGKLPIIKGITLKEDDVLRRFVISEIICNFELDFAQVKSEFGVEVKDYFADALQALSPMIGDQLIELTEDGLAIKPSGRLLVRKICMAFDAYLDQPAANAIAPQYSRIL